MVSGVPEQVPQQRRLLTEIPGPRSRELWARRERAIPKGVSTTLPVFVIRAGPGILEDVDGNRLIDFGSGISTTNAGNSAPLVVEAIWEQSALFTHTCFQVTPYAGYVEVCEHLNELTPGDHEKRSFLVNSGAEAIENVVKVARYATGRPGIVAFDHGFHGRTLLTMTLTGKEMPYKHGFGPFAPEVHRAPYSYPFRGTGRLADTIAVLETSVGAESIAAVLVEPIAGEGGVVVPEAGWLAGLASWCRERAFCSWRTRSRPASGAPATGSPASTRGSCPTWWRPPRAWGAGCPSAG
jgi:4-aminobutyrate aminotransferase/(S)-3-amino-2-methylpropionate transaminase